METVWDSKTKGINHIQKAKHTVLASDEVYKMKMALQKKRKRNNLTHYAQSTSMVISGQREEKGKVREKQQRQEKALENKRIREETN